ncbi:MAG TPA: aminotransferase class III-fold pyridoxal phosphate-dependent enzyme, partial [Methylomirabilota bacterium]|nr:aminotransferase class III-fold pyridoxal phosphate-dependent enzyme [Methylomirabilota bacterium]
MLPTLARSIGLFDRGQDLLPGGVSSPGRAFAEVETPPIFLESGEGCHVVDADGNRYMDFIGGLGPLILGHRPPAVQRALEAQLARGTVFATPNALEYALAERILASTPPLERLRFACSGTEAAMTALRIAKAVTGRPKVLKFSGGYHGHADTLLARGAKPHMRGRGCRVHDGLDDAVVQNTIVVSYNDVGGV